MADWKNAFVGPPNTTAQTFVWVTVRVAVGVALLQTANHWGGGTFVLMSLTAWIAWVYSSVMWPRSTGGPCVICNTCVETFHVMDEKANPFLIWAPRRRATYVCMAHYGTWLRMKAMSDD